MKTILITGSTSGIGYATAKELTLQGYKVIIHGKNLALCKKIAEELKSDFVCFDVTNNNDLLEQTRNLEIDCLINNAGFWIQGELVENDFESIQKCININATALINITKVFVEKFKKKGKGEIINIDSQAGLYTKKERSVYHASKFAVTGFTRALQNEVSSYGIKVTAVFPGLVDTELFIKQGINRDMTNSVTKEQVANLISYIVNLPDNVLIPEVGIVCKNHFA